MLPPPAFIRSTAHRSAVTYGARGCSAIQARRAERPFGQDRGVLPGPRPDGGVAGLAKAGADRRADLVERSGHDSGSLAEPQEPGGDRWKRPDPGSRGDDLRQHGGRQGEVGNEVAHPGALAHVPGKPPTSGRRVGHRGQAQAIEDRLARSRDSASCAPRGQACGGDTRPCERADRGVGVPGRCGGTARPAG